MFVTLLLSPSGQNKNYKAFQRSVYENKSCISQSLQNLSRDIDQKLIDCPFVLCYVLASNQSFDEKLDAHGRNKQRLVLFLC